MNQDNYFFIRGLFRIGVGLIALALLFVALNVFGYLAITFNFPFIPDPTYVGSSHSYLGRASELAYFGLLVSSVYIVSILVLGMVLFGLYRLIVIIGSYSQEGHKK